jgi:hypothetical protein
MQLSITICIVGKYVDYVSTISTVSPKKTCEYVLDVQCSEKRVEAAIQHSHVSV